MSILNEVREFFETNLGRKIDHAGLIEKLDTDDRQGLSVALFALHKNGDIQREKKPSGVGYHYWSGTAVAKNAGGAHDNAVDKATNDAPHNAITKSKRTYKKRTPPPGIRGAPFHSARPSGGWFCGVCHPA